MKKLGIAAVIIGSILLLAGILGSIVMAGSGVPDWMLSNSMAMIEMSGMSNQIGAGKLFLLRIIQYRTAIIVAGLILIAGGIVMIRKGKSPRRPQRGYVAQSRQQDPFMLSQEQPDAPEVLPVPRSDRRRPSVSPGLGAGQTLLPFREDRCCVCDRSLADGHAVLYTNEYGAEARIDSVCYEAIHTLSSSEDGHEVEKALNYIRSRLKNVDPIVAGQLSKYIQSGEEFLYQDEEEY